MGAHGGLRRFAPPRGMLVAVLLCEALALVGAVATVMAGGLTTTSAVLLLCAAVGAGGVAETLVRRVELEEDAIRVVDLFSRRRIRRAEIAGVEEARGCPTTLVLRDGSAWALPDVAPRPGNSIRAWLRATP